MSRRKELSTTTHATGGCLCGEVRYEVNGPLRNVVACHCEQCRRTSGHFVAATWTAIEDFTLTEEKGLRWYVSSETAQRGFCGTCGSSLFWEQTRDDSSDSPHTISIMAGTLDTPTGLELVHHIFVDFKGDYYEIAADDEQTKVS